MSAPVGDPNIFGPGTLKIGATGSEIDASCAVNSLKITASPDRGDSKTMLCGTVKAGNTRYDYTMDGTLDLDLESGADSLFALSQDNPGTEQAFVFTPNTGGITSAAGTLILDPMDFGGDEYGAVMQSDVSWVLVGAPAYTYGTGALTLTGVTAGSPGTFPADGGTDSGESGSA